MEPGPRSSAPPRAARVSGCSAPSSRALGPLAARTRSLHQGASVRSALVLPRPRAPGCADALAPPGRACALRAALSRPRALAARTRSLHQVSLALTSVARRGWHPPPNTLFVPPSRLPKPRSAGPLGRCGRRVASLVTAWQSRSLRSRAVESPPMPFGRASVAVRAASCVVLPCGRRGTGARHASQSEFRSLRGKLARSGSQ
jgi:hypothetical protein